MKDDDFAKKAFADAEMASMEKEADEYCKRLGGPNLIRVLDSIAFNMGLDKMEAISKVIVTNGMENNFTELVKGCLVIGFHEGYNAAKQTAE